MAKIDTAFNNFARGKIDHDMMGRHDLPVYTSAADLVENWITNFKGNAIYRAGFETMVIFEDCTFVEFKFNNQQQYLCVFFASKIRFLSYDTNGDFGWVLDSMSAILEVSSPYSLAQARQASYSQNNDVMVFCHGSFAPYKLTRVSAASFTFATFSRTADPFTGAGLYPSQVLFYKGRLYYAAPTTKITTIYASVAGSYDDFTLSPITDASAIIFTIADIAQKIEWLFAGDNSLIVGASDGIVAVNGGDVKKAITAATIDATLTSAPPCNSTYPLKKDGLIFYVGLDGRNMYYFNYNLLNEAFQASDANFISYDITEGGIKKIRYKKDRNDLIFATTNSSDRNLLSCNFNSEEKIIGWHNHLSDGDFLDQGVITDNDGKPQMFALIKYGSAYYVEKQAEYVEFKQRVKFFTRPSDSTDVAKAAAKASDDEAYNRYVAQQLKNCIYLDNAIVYDNLQSNLITFSGGNTITATSNVFSSGSVGKHIVYKTSTGYESGRFLITGYTSAKIVTVEVLQAPTSNTYTDWYLSFSAILSGLDQYNGTTISVVADGGYLNDFAVSGGACTFGKEVTHVVMGYRYKGVIKSFCLGLQIQGVNTQTTMKAVSQFGVRCVSTAGLEVGTDLYHTEPVQELSQNDLNYLPPIPIDGTKYVAFSDDNTQDKFFYLVQDLPLPATVTSIILNANHALTP